MPEDSEKYLHFHVALLKDSFAIEALRRDALKYHMIDHPGQLIALRLTEYYEMMARGVVPSGASGALATAAGLKAAQETTTAASSNGSANSGIAASDFAEKQDDTLTPAQDAGDERMVMASPDAEQNAEEAADYWALL